MNATQRSGFTLIELLIVVLIICILMGLFMPVINQARNSARKLKCMNNLRQLGVATFSYAEDYNGQLPAGYDEQWAPWMSILTNSVLVPSGIPAKAGTYPAVFQCPSAKLAGGANHYIASPGVYAMVPRGGARQIRARTTDMRSDLILLSDGAQETTYGNSTRELIFDGQGWAGFWHDGTGSKPDGDDNALSIMPVIPEGTIGFYTSWRHTNQCNTLFGDGHVGSANFNTQITQGQFQITRGNRKWEWEWWVP